MRIRLGRGFWTSRFGLALLGIVGALILAGAGIFTWYYVQYSHMIDARLGGQVFTTASRVFAAPPRIYVGQALTPGDLASYLQRAGYTEPDLPGALGRYQLGKSSMEIRPGAESYFRATPGLRIEFAGGEIARIRSIGKADSLGSAELEPELLTNLFDSSREKRRFVRFADLPKPVVDAVLSAEDKRFFEHPGFDPVRVLGAAWADLRRGTMAQGASTLTMQVARSFFFSTARTWRRKLAETLVALELEQRFSKEEIFELYANEIYLGNRGSFAIHGFGEAAQAYFGKDARDLTLAEAAFLAGIIRAPNRYSAAERYPDRAAEARDRVLKQMVENRAASEEAAEAARKAGLRFTSPARVGGAAPYFVDMVKEHLQDRFSEAELTQQSFRIYTTLDPALQRAAAEAVTLGMKDVDAQLARRYERWRKRKEPVPQAQVALIALDPRSGEIRALIGGRDYGQSQLNRVLARRQPGSAFKPFVYAAAFENAVDGIDPIVTPITTVMDEPTTFFYEGKEYSPKNYGAEFHGTVTLRAALRQSLNVATVKVAEMIGYGRVADLAHEIGLDPKILATPAVALGAYEMTPRDVAAGYTVFANNGVRAEPMYIRSVVSSDGVALERNAPRLRPALDPRVAYMVTNVLEDVINRGTAAGVRARGFTAPAAGKTGTSHDAWFAGFTSNLLCVVWVGFDDNRELELSGAASAAPIWAEFMKRAVSLPGYQNTEPFAPPDGVVTVNIDPETLQLATPHCPVVQPEVFVYGSEPSEMCQRHGRNIAQTPPVSWLAGVFGEKKPAPSRDLGTPSTEVATSASPVGPEASGGTPPTKPVSKAKGKVTVKTPPVAKAEPEKKKGLLERIFGIFGSSKKDEKEKPRPAP